MMYLVLLVAGIVLWVVGLKEEKDELVPLGIILTVGCTIGSFLTLAIGLTTYPDLVIKQAEVLSFQSEIQNVRKASYPNTTKSIGAFVGGSLDNLQQSSKLSEYIMLYAKEKAKYNKKLASAHVYKENLIFKWVGNGFFISKKIYELKPIE